MEDLKLFVWENVLRNSKSGIAFAFANDSIEARKLVIKELGYNHEDFCDEPREIKEPEAFVVHGGL